MRILPVAILSVALLSTAACSGMNDKEQRALSGGAIGAGAGALVGVMTGSWVTGAVIGGAGGAAVGALTGKDNK